MTAANGKDGRRLVSMIPAEGKTPDELASAAWRAFQGHQAGDKAPPAEGESAEGETGDAETAEGVTAERGDDAN